jgi:amidohydrolase
VDRAQLKQAVCAEIDARQDAITGIAQRIWQHPELGYKEVKTAALVKETLAGLGLPVREGLAITGVDGILQGAQPGPSVVVMGELDSVVGRDAPQCDPVTGAAHLCGHHIQVASMLGAAMGLAASGAAAHLAGRVQFLGVPAEEFLEMEYRLGLQDQGQITFLGGKPELIKRGYFDDVDMAMMVHSFPNAPEPGFYLDAKGNGFMAKFIQYGGKSAHAGAAPHEGVNALNAACLGILAVHAQRETFRDQDAIRVHPIITKGGDVVNIVPSDVRLETYVRGRTVDAIVEASHKVDRALRAGGDAVGAQTQIRNVPGYLPFFQDDNLTRLAATNGEALLGERGKLDAGFMGGSFDLGDLAHLKPVLHPFVGGAQGSIHTAGFSVVDYEAAAVLPAKLMAMCVIDLLADDAHEARRVVDEFRPVLTKERYLALMAEMVGGQPAAQA